MRKLGILILTSAAVCACINLDNVNQVKDLRILAVRADPPELVYSFLHLFPADQRGGLALGPYPMTFQVLAVDPQGRDVDLSIRLCPEEEKPVALGCEGYQVRANAPQAEINQVVPLVQPMDFSRKADLSLGGELAVPSFSMTYGDRALDYMLPHTLDGKFDLSTALLYPTYPSVVVRARVAGKTEQEVAFKRFSLGLDISPSGVPEALRDQLQGIFQNALGLDFCVDGVDPTAEANCIQPRRANRNPHITRVLYKVGQEVKAAPDPHDPTSGGEFQDLVGRPKVAPGETVRVRAVVPPEDAEPYQGISFDLQNAKVTLTNYTEDLVFTWYTTVGDTDGTTTTVFAPTADNNWQVSQDAENGPAFVWVVVRDQRGGVDWRRLDFEVEVPPGGGGNGFGF